jgi:hypothetical protein
VAKQVRRSPQRSEGYERGRTVAKQVRRSPQRSDALDLDNGVFTLDDPKNIARSLEKSAEKSTRKKGSSYQSAMSMLNFYINRAGKNLPAKKKKVLERAKDVLKELRQKDQRKKEDQVSKKDQAKNKA